MTAQPASQAARVEIAIAVVERDGACLIGLRSGGEALAGFWEFPGGKVEAGEAPEAAATRECREEAGLEVRVVAPLLTVEHDYAHGQLRLHFFRCAVVDTRGELPARFRWVERSQLNNYKFPPANRDVIAMLVGGAA